MNNSSRNTKMTNKSMTGTLAMPSLIHHINTKVVRITFIKINHFVVVYGFERGGEM